MIPLQTNALDGALASATLVILEFSSPGCAPCKAVAAVLNEIMDELKKEDLPVTAYTVDITREPELAQKYFVFGVPTLILFKNSEEIQRLNSVPKKEKLLQFIKSSL